MKYRFAAPALDEYERAAEYYDACNPGLGTEFVRAVDDQATGFGDCANCDQAKIVASGTSHPPVTLRG